MFDAHRDDPEFGYRFLTDEVRDAGHVACERTVWKTCRDNAWWSSFGKKKSSKRSKPGPPAHDDLVRRVFTAEEPNQLWLTDITEHPTVELTRDLGHLILGWNPEEGGPDGSSRKVPGGVPT